MLVKLAVPRRHVAITASIVIRIVVQISSAE